MSSGGPPSVSAAVRITTVVAVVVVALVAAIVSYAHMQEVAERAGERWRSWMVPLSVDGLIVAGSMVLLVRRRAGLAGGWLAWAALLGGVGASLGCNVAAAEATTIARLIAAWPPLAFAAAFELLLQQRRSTVPEHAVGHHPATDQQCQRRESLPAATLAAPAAAVVEPVDQVRPTRTPGGEPVGARVGELIEPLTPIVPLFPDVLSSPDPLVARVAAMVATGRQTGHPVGRRTVAKELGVSEHRASQLLAATNGVS
ncbi:MAG: DUF2637 domain-containing protein [Actinomycetes bacterium]